MIYLDYNATTPLDPRVLEAMTPLFTKHFGNPASRHHKLGGNAAKFVETAREQVASTIKADPREIIWTSGATESNNLALQGVARSSAYRKKHVVTVVTEHRAILDPCEILENQGFDVTYVGVDSNGCLDLEQLATAITDQTLMVSVMHANNEIGVIHPIAKIGVLCKERGVLFHTDATQSFGKEPIDVNMMNIDLLSASGHKIHGPKGVGVLYIRRRNPRVRCEPLIYGGGHERGLRSGTLNVPSIVGMGAASTFPLDDEVRRMRDQLEYGICSQLDGVDINGHRTQRLANTTNLSFRGVSGNELMKRMPDIALSSSSACTSAQLQPSYVLGAIKCSKERIAGSVRFSLGRFNTPKEIEVATERVVDSVKALRDQAS
ncbi:MAG: cysteine desulfurase family protein [Acidobacteriota bacterium]|nr:cysteine desulfurase family protein [Acidobacteriota bacterium]